MLSIVLATRNRSKAAEIQAMLQGHWHCKILTLEDVGFTNEIQETGKTFAENAENKAKTVRKFLNQTRQPYLVLAEDSGLVVEALDGRPGVYTAHYGGEDCGGQAKRDLLRQELRGKKCRVARYECVMTASSASGLMASAIGFTRGDIIDEERGTNGLDFDSIFYSHELEKTLAEATVEEKNRISHRGRALERLMEYLCRNPTLATQLSTP